MFGPLSAKMRGAALAKTRRRAGVKKAGERARNVKAPANPLLSAVRVVKRFIQTEGRFRAVLWLRM